MAAVEVVGGGCRRGVKPGRGAICGGAPSVAVDVHLQDGRVVDQAVDGGDGDGLIGEDAVPGAEGLVGGDGETAGLVASGDELEEDGCLGLVLLGVGDVVEDDQVEAVELIQGSLEREVAPRGLELLNEISGSGVEDAPTGFDESVADGAEEVRLACARVADGDEVGAGLDPVAGGERLDAGAGYTGQGLEVEGSQGLAAGQA